MILIGLLGLLAATCPVLIRALKRQRRERLIALQLRQSLQCMTHALQIGTSFLQAIERAAQEGDDPLASEWKLFIHSVRMGTSIPEALEDLGQRVPLKEMKWFVSAAQITQQSGGSLASVLESLAGTLQERETLREKVAALTAQGKASGALLSLLPFLMILVLYIIAPAMIKPLFTSFYGELMLSSVIGLVSIGSLVILKIVTIKVD
jgi:tight adherence protein B